MTKQSFYDIYYSNDLTKLEKFIKYFRNKNSLTADESKFLFLEYQKDKVNGVELENSIPRTILILAYDRLVKYVLIKVMSFDFNEDLLSVGKIGLINAIDKFDIERNIEFKNYAVVVIKNTILAYLKNQNKLDQDKMVMSLDNYFLEDEEQINLYDAIGEEDEFFTEFFDKIQFESLVPLFNYLNHNEQFLLFNFCRFFSINYPNQEIARKLNVDDTIVSKRLANVKNKLRILSLSQENLSGVERVKQKIYLSASYKLMNFQDFKNYEYQSYELPEKIYDCKTYLNSLSWQDRKQWLRIQSQLDRPAFINYLSFLTDLEKTILLDFCGINAKKLPKNTEIIAQENNLKLYTVLDLLHSAYKKIVILFTNSQTQQIYL